MTPDEIAQYMRLGSTRLTYEQAQILLDDRARLQQEVERLNRLLATQQAAYEAELDAYREWKEVHDDVDPS